MARAPSDASSSPLVAALLGKTKQSVKATPKKVSVVQVKTPQASFDPTPYRPPSMTKQMRDSAKHAKVRATEDWVSGRISTTEHDKIHGRADHVIKNGGRKKGKR